MCLRAQSNGSLKVQKIFHRFRTIVIDSVHEIDDSLQQWTSTFLMMMSEFCRCKLQLQHFPGLCPFDYPS